MQHRLFLLIALLLTGVGPLICVQANEGGVDVLGERPRVVFIVGDEEYRSEESMPMLARILDRDFNLDVRVCYPLAGDGTIDPNQLDSISGLDSLEDADLMVLFTRFRQLPDEQLKRIKEFAASGRPVVGFRTATHAFRYPGEDPRAEEMNETWPRELFGQRWITHHGHFGDNTRTLTGVTLLESAREHVILRGVDSFEAYSWLYHVAGGGDALYGVEEQGETAPTVLVEGRSLKSGYEKGNGFDRFPRTQPLAWTYERPDGQRVFFTTLGHPFDFKDANMRRLSLNGILWALDREEWIPGMGCTTEFVGTYDPAPAGFGDVFREGVRPEPIQGGAKAPARGKSDHQDSPQSEGDSS